MMTLDPALKNASGTVGNNFYGSIELTPKYIGTDCLAFVKNSILYSGTSYLWKDTVFRRFLYNEPSCYIIISRKADDFDTRSINLRKVVPGDVFYYLGHIGIVVSNDGTGMIEGLKFIEAYYNGSTSYVDNTRTLLLLDIKQWTIVRLK